MVTVHFLNGTTAMWPEADNTGTANDILFVYQDGKILAGCSRVQVLYWHLASPSEPGRSVAEAASS